MPFWPSAMTFLLFRERRGKTGPSALSVCGYQPSPASLGAPGIGFGGVAASVFAPDCSEFLFTGKGFLEGVDDHSIG